MNKILVIVDVQKKFDEFIQHDLVDGLSKYAEIFETVYQIWDTHNNTIAPTHSFPGQVDSIPKKFGKKHFSDEVTSFIKEIEKSSKNGRTFKLTDEEGYVVRVKNNHDWFYVNPEIVDLISKLKGNKIILAGGADGECLEDIYQAFLAFGLKVHINKKYTYSAKTSQKDSVKEKVLIPNIPKKFLYENNNDIENATEIVIIIKNNEEKDIFNNMLIEINYGYNLNYIFKTPCIVYLSINNNWTMWATSNSKEYDTVIYNNIENGKQMNNVYKKPYKIDDIKTVEYILKNKKIIDDFGPNYKPKKFLYEDNNDIENANEIAIILRTIKEKEEINKLLIKVNQNYDLSFVVSFPCVIYVNIKNPITAWGTPDTDNYDMVINNDIEKNEILNGVYKKPFTFDDIGSIEYIINNGKIINNFSPNYKPKKFLF